VLNIVQSINTSVAALEGLFNELLDISKIDSGVIKPHLTHFPLDQVFARLQDEFAAEAQAKGLRLIVAGGGGHVVESDALLLERIVRNLLGNAIRYTSVGEIGLEATPANGSLRIAVRDTGAGIRPQDQQRIFEEFVQLSNPGRTSRKGLGLGLSIVQRLCALLGYEIRLASEPGKGSTFSFEVPRGVEGKVARHDVAAPGMPADLSGRLVVVIDDEFAIVEGMRVLLSGWGIEVIGSATGDDVVQAVHSKERMPDLIIADYRLAGGAVGTDVVERLRRELDPEIPAILVTGSTGPERVSEADAKRYDLLLKPVNPEALREAIKRKLQRS
jgi:CheY-like chemotaxis protein